MKIQNAQYNKFDKIRKLMKKLDEQLGYNIIEFYDMSMSGYNSSTIREMYKTRLSYERNRFNRPIRLNDDDIKFLEKIYNKCYKFYKKELKRIEKRERVLNDTGKVFVDDN